MLDAPVSGGPEGAQNGTLAIMVGGDAADFEKALPILEIMGKTVTHVGPIGAGTDYQSDQSNHYFRHLSYRRRRFNPGHKSRPRHAEGHRGHQWRGCQFVGFTQPGHQCG